jgi:hypothetical protein
MSKTADPHGSKRGRPESGLLKAPGGLGAFAPVLAQRPTSGQPPPLPTGGETMQYQVPLELLVLARNREKDKARSVAVTPVAPRPRADEPPPSSELSDLRAPEATPPTPERAGAEPIARADEQPVASEPAASEPAASKPAVSSEPALSSKSSSAAKLAFLLAALCVIAGYCAVELLHWY